MKYGQTLRCVSGKDDTKLKDKEIKCVKILIIYHLDSLLPDTKNNFVSMLHDSFQLLQIILKIFQIRGLFIIAVLEIKDKQTNSV